MPQAESNIYRDNSILCMSDDEYRIANAILNGKEAKALCDKLATATGYTSFEWSNTIICAVTDYVGMEGMV